MLRGNTLSMEHFTLGNNSIPSLKDGISLAPEAQRSLTRHHRLQHLESINKSGVLSQTPGSGNDSPLSQSISLQDATSCLIIPHPLQPCSGSYTASAFSLPFFYCSCWDLGNCFRGCGCAQRRGMTTGVLLLHPGHDTSSPEFQQLNAGLHLLLKSHLVSETQKLKQGWGCAVRMLKRWTIANNNIYLV